MEKDPTLTWDRQGQLLGPMMLTGIRERDRLKGIYGWAGLQEAGADRQRPPHALRCFSLLVSWGARRLFGSALPQSCVSDGAAGGGLPGANSRGSWACCRALPPARVGGLGQCPDSCEPAQSSPEDTHSERASRLHRAPHLACSPDRS